MEKYLIKDGVKNLKKPKILDSNYFLSKYDLLKNYPDNGCKHI